ncbi:MAG: SAM-dependent methyltransferase [Bacteroidota bacterium]
MPYLEWMSTVFNTSNENEYWSKRYAEQRTGWDIGAPSTPLKAYIDQLPDDSQLRILIPGAGNAYEAEYLFASGYQQVFVLDIAEAPLQAFQQRVPHFPSTHLICDNFFTHQQNYDLILEQTFFCSFPPTSENRQAYAQKTAELLPVGGKLVGLWFSFPLTSAQEREEMEKRPFGGSKEEYLTYLTPFFSVKTFAPCYNSIPPRQGNELFGIFERM